MKKIICILILAAGKAFGQNPLPIPPSLSGTTFNLTIQNGTTQFYPGINTPTYGINGNILGPTLIVNQGDWVNINVTNTLTGFGNSTTIHWHGLHVPAIYDGGPHQIIAQNSTWNPNFQILNSAGSFWYHPHGNNKTDLHVSRGIAGMIIVKDSVEAALTLPRSYGVDDFPVVVQTKAFDILNQIAIATEMDTMVLANGAVHTYLDAPAQVIRLRLLNGASSRTFNFGFSGNRPFKMIASDAGLLDSAITLTRIMLSPGERAEILLDLQNDLGNTIFLKSFSSEMPNGIYGAATVTGMMGGTIPDYNLNPLNGIDFDILQLNVIIPTANPVLTMPGALTTLTPWTNYTTTRNFQLSPDTMMSAQGQVAGPFNINGVHFDMNTINVTTYLNTTERWRITNQTGIAHPFHIHDMHFFIQDINGGTVPNYLKGKKDVVLVNPQQYVDIITTFEDFANDSVPYMYHCHILHHEDDGMMGSFRVIDTSSTGVVKLISNGFFSLYPNPSSEEISIEFAEANFPEEVSLIDVTGQTLIKNNFVDGGKLLLNISDLNNGIYFVRIKTKENCYTKRFIKAGR